MFFKKNFWLLIAIFISGCSTHNIDISHLQKVKNFNVNEVTLISKHTKDFNKNTQLSIVKIKNGEVSFYGVIKANQNIENINNQDKIFEIGSISKLFTSTLLAQMVINGKIDLNENIQDKLKLKLNKGIIISYKELANHTSGLPNMPYFRDKAHYENYNYKDLEEYLQNNLEIKEKKFKYSNLGFAILGYLLSEITQKSYEELVQKKILQKLKMHDSSTIKNSTKLVSSLISDSTSVPPAMVSAGGLFSSAKDLSKFALASFDNKNKDMHLTQQETIYDTKLFNLYSIRFGLGWNIENSEFTKKLHTHSGATNGYSSFIVLDIESKNGIIILSNRPMDKNNTISLLAMELLKVMYL